MRAALLCLLCACDPSVIPVDACLGATDPCITFHLTAEPALGDPLIGRIAMWVTYTLGGVVQNKQVLSSTMEPPLHFPIARGLELSPSISGTAKVRIEALSGPGPAAYRVVSVMAKSGQLDVIMQTPDKSLCFNNELNGKTVDGESDIDCGGDCPPCIAQRLCKTAADCQSAMCSNSHCL